MDPSIFGKGLFENVKMIKAVSLPVYAIYGEKDKYVQNVKKLQPMIRNAKKFVSVEGVVDIENESYDEYIEHLSSFVVDMFSDFKSLFSGAALETIKPKAFLMDPIDIVRSYLEECGLGKYTETFISFGYLREEDIEMMIDEDIEMIGMTPEECTILKNKIAKSKGANGTNNVAVATPNNDVPNTNTANLESNSANSANETNVDERKSKTPRF